MDDLEFEGLSRTAALLSNYASRLKESRKYLAAIAALRRAVNIHPDNAVLWGNLGAILFNIADYDGAYEAFINSLSLDDSLTAPHGNFGLLLSAMERFDEAEQETKIAMAFDPDNLILKWDWAMLLLNQGKWPEGLKEYEVRIKQRGEPFYPKMPYPVWNGEDLTNKTIYIQAEQGNGDRILFSRFLPWIKNKYENVRILYLCKPDMQNLMWEFRHIVEFLPEGIPYPPADYGLFEMSLARLYGLTTDNVPPDSGLFLKRALQHKDSVNFPQPLEPALKVGIAWTGNPAQSRNETRSIPLELMLGLAENPKVVLYSLQVGHGSDDISRLGADEIVFNFDPELRPRGYAGTAAVMLHLDLVISVCTSVSHLAGALNVPCWTMLSTDAYWIWLRGRNDNLWYPNLKLYRQNKPNDWKTVLSEIKTDLAQLADKHVANLISNPNLLEE